MHWREGISQCVNKMKYLFLIQVSGLKRVNVIMRRGGQALQKHMEKVIDLSKLVDKYAKDLDEKG